MMAGGLALSIFFYGAGNVQAAGRYSKKEAEVTAKQTELTQPSKRAAETTPALNAKPFLLGVREPINAATDGQIKLLEKLNGMTKETDPEKPDLLFRLGQLFEEKARSYNIRARELDEEIFQIQAQLNSI